MGKMIRINKMKNNTSKKRKYSGLRKRGIQGGETSFSTDMDDVQQKTDKTNLSRLIRTGLIRTSGKEERSKGPGKKEWGPSAPRTESSRGAGESQVMRSEEKKDEAANQATMKSARIGGEEGLFDTNRKIYPSKIRWGKRSTHYESSVSWAKKGGGFNSIAMPTQVDAGSVGPTTAYEAIVNPTQKTMTFVQALGSGNPNRLGRTTAPTAYTVPNFDFNTNENKTGKTSTWTATPTSLAKANEGNNTCYYIGAGTHKTQHTENEAGVNVPVYWTLSANIASLNHDAELEHSNDIRQAYKISLKEAQDVLTNHVIGKNFGPESSEALVKQKVLNKITAKLTHAQLGNDKTQWGNKYRTLWAKTGLRDSSNWHSFGMGARTIAYTGTGKTKKPTKVTYAVTKGSTSINVTSSAAQIVY